MASPGRIPHNDDLDLQRELEQLEVHCEAVLHRLRSTYGIEDHRTIRAQELCNYFQRLRLVLTRNPGQVAQGISTHRKAHLPNKP